MCIDFRPVFLCLYFISASNTIFAHSHCDYPSEHYWPFFMYLHFLNVFNESGLFLLLLAQHCAYIPKASFLCSLADSPSSHPSSLHLPDSLSSGSIKSLLICPFLLIWIHTGSNCWLGSAKETRLNEVHKTHCLPLSLCMVIFVHACVFMSALTHNSWCMWFFTDYKSLSLLFF